MSPDTELRDPVSREQDGAPGDPTVAGARSSRRRDAVIVVVALLVGMGGFAAYGAVTDPDGPPPAAPIDADLEPVTPVAEAGSSSVAAGSPAASAVEAVDAFLSAEADGDFETSFALLSEAQRSTYGSVPAWRNAHADFFPVVGHRLVEADDGTIRTEVEYRSSLDEVVGLVPARATVEWVVVQEAGGWAVDFDASAVQPIYPDDAAAAEAVRDWATDLQRCEEPVQYEGALVATADLVRAAESLCDSDGRIGAGPARTVDEFDASPLVSAFGTDALAWARAVELDGPAELTVVVAPVDDRWVVVGLLPA